MRNSAGIRDQWPRLLAAALLIAAVVLLVGCSTGDPQNTLAPDGDVARKQRDLFNLVLWPAIAVLVIVEGALFVALMRFRKRAEQPPPTQVHGNMRLEVAWTIAPAVLLLVLAVPMIALIIDVGRAPKADALPVRVIGHQWLWEFQYPELKNAEGKPLTTFSELHIPVEREIAIGLESADVIHSFGVPRLAGHLDAVPGRTNRFYLNAVRPGSYSGQCFEFCGLGHADMRLVVIAQSEDEFQAWVDEQLQGQSAAESGSQQPAAVRQGE